MVMTMQHNLPLKGLGARIAYQRQKSNYLWLNFIRYNINHLMQTSSYITKAVDTRAHHTMYPENQPPDLDKICKALCILEYKEQSKEQA